MAKLTRTERHEITSTYPHWPQYCNQCRCDSTTNEIQPANMVKPTVVAIMEVANEKGERLSGAFSDFGDTHAQGKPLRPGFSFRNWHTFCEVCYLKHVTRQGLNQGLTFKQWEKRTGKVLKKDHKREEIFSAMRALIGAMKKSLVD